MKRRLFKFALFLLLGAVVNVAVAWGCAAWINPYKYDPERRFRRSDQSTWGLTARVAPGLTHLISARTWQKDAAMPNLGVAPEELVPSWSDLDEKSDEFLNVIARAPDSLVRELRYVHFAGWPTRSLWCHWYTIGPIGSPIFYGNGGIIFSLEPWSKYIPRALPTRPIWIGFILNTIFYAAIIWLLTLGPFNARRMWLGAGS